MVYSDSEVEFNLNPGSMNAAGVQPLFSDGDSGDDDYIQPSQMPRGRGLLDVSIGGTDNQKEEVVLIALPSTMDVGNGRLVGRDREMEDQQKQYRNHNVIDVISVVIRLAMKIDSCMW